MKIFKVIIVVLFVALIIIQFLPKDLPEIISKNEGDILAKVSMAPEVSQILKASCYDCHSNETKYPWYSYVAPVSWLVGNDVKEGRDELNFSEWTAYPKRRMVKKLEDIKEEVGKGDMPLPIYTLIHTKTKLSVQQRDLITKWTEEMTNSLMNE